MGKRAALYAELEAPPDHDEASVRAEPFEVLELPPGVFWDV